MGKLPIGLQLYTLRNETEEDFAGTLQKVKDIGYEGVEFAGFGGYSASELKELLASIGLQAFSSHVPLQTLRDDLEETIRYHKEAGIHYIICPFLDESERSEYELLAATLDEIGGTCREAGLTFCYHNHDFEFERVDGEYALDLIMNHTMPANVSLELDTYWAERAGVNAPGYSKSYTGRLPLVHIKDLKSKDNPTFAEVGEGILDISVIIAAAEEAGANYLIVEQDLCERSPLESIEISYKNLQRIYP
ncbi:sugar phosphate isomerase/epimerase family protein [Shouchella shacheensis]|uniref:sugar phosphate isomerase/epimerase family protein n=1 Tax=Shouchella shacheensis TaxID=1649580 RepID=UPI00073FBF2A|nr:sugar phosphate isomerase/epimerase [Shouchella shacheensis]